MSRRKHKNKGRLPPFVPLHIGTMETPAWKALTMGARALYAQIKRHHFVGIKNNNGRIYLSIRNAMDELGVSNHHSISRWFRELQHYGFIVQTQGGCLGIDGKGKAPHWRVTELPTLTERETQDYLRWDGTPFPGNGNQLGRGRKKQNPVAETTSRVRPKQPTPVWPKPPTLHPPSEGGTTHISADQGVAETTHISRITTTGGRVGSDARKDGPENLDWPEPKGAVIDLPPWSEIKAAMKRRP